MSSPVAIIDVGSNSIKLLVADKDPEGRLRTLFMRTCDSRISKGISKAEPRLTEEGMAVGIEAISSLLGDAVRHLPGRIQMVATSAVRTALNGAEFCERVLAATGQELRVLSGDEEAEYIGKGLACDPTLRGLGNFYVFDLGGGSMECLAYRNESSAQSLSLALGCVRLTERFIAKPELPLSPAEISAIATHTKETLRASAFRFDLPAGAKAVFAGGSMTTARAIVGATEGKSLADAPLVLSLDVLRQLLGRLSSMPLEERRQAVPGLPPARADVFPAALATMIATGELAGVDSFQHSTYNLRFGMASKLLA